MVTFERVNELFSYNSETGIVIRKISVSNVKAGTECKHHDTGGYLTVGIDGKYYPAHRIAWLLFYGKHADGNIDHINRIKTDNRISNLRVVSQLENCHNLSMRKKNKSGYRGVSWHSSSKKWQADIKVNGKGIYLGVFEKIEDAVAARRKAEITLMPSVYLNYVA